MRQWNVTWLVLLIALGLTACSPPRYRPAQLGALKAEEVRGLISRQEPGSFRLTDENGVENKYLTGSKVTEYLPRYYRSQAGDRVRVTYVVSLKKGDAEPKRIVLQLEALEVPERNQALTEITGKIVAFNSETFLYSERISIKPSPEEPPLRIYVRDNSPAEYRLDSKSRVVGRRATVKLRRLPSFRGNSYVYEAEDLIFLD